MKQPRRNFLKKAALTGAAAFTFSDLVHAAGTEAKAKKIRIAEGDTILFQGDSITDFGRKRDKQEANDTGAMGSGYAMLAAAELLYKKAGQNLRIFNRGVSGNKVFQLAERWETDTLELKPNILSILIGVNDYWHTKNNYQGTPEIYRKDYIALLERTRDKLPEVKLILGEPFALSGISAVDDSWYPEFNEYRSAAAEVARQFDAVFIPYQSIFDKATEKAPGKYWTYDGVHTTLAGSQLMAAAWLSHIR